LKILKSMQSVVINQPAEEIFAYLSDLENLVDWSGSLITVRKISPGALHVGAMGQSTMRFLGRWMDITFEIVEYEPSRYLTLKSLRGITPCVFSYQLEPTNDPGLWQATKEWLRGELRLISTVKRAQIFQRVARHNARHLLEHF